MSLTYEQARDEMLLRFRTQWQLQPTPPPVLWPNVAGEPPATGPWARVTIRHAAGSQATLGGRGGRRFRRTGTVFVQIFTPKGTGLARADQMAKIATDAFEGRDTPGGVWFRNVRLNETNGEAGWDQVNVLADFEYDEIK